MDSFKSDLESPRKPLPLPSATNLLTPVVAEPAGFPWLLVIAFLFLTINCVQAVYQARGDPWSVSFVVSAYSALVLLFWCLRQLERLPRDGTSRLGEQRLKLAVWMLAMLLNAMFSYRVAAMMPPAFAVVIWAVAGFTTVAAFYAFFIYREPAAPAVDGAAPAVPSGKIWGAGVAPAVSSGKL